MIGSRVLRSSKSLYRLSFSRYAPCLLPSLLFLCSREEKEEDEKQKRPGAFVVVVGDELEPFRGNTIQSSFAMEHRVEHNARLSLPLCST